ncbi:hypothetical protein GLOIN_2v752299 [Rhizophagus irregularis DAOM 181602=DAOM 197198]|uniref:Uncharacterized protein n=1 Tax=Rhizophagus irregularis (strain DAOM 181602 / DAOM 197198 / MUCL 43194) TaxID=747089 RepID=A0A2P4P5W0_RHIID|nr:hypothetical protein GLOIN_2v752299 [Rhizophagus irregularis DAOM 181602=DAOM 197198]POG60775.1 hypothetical protein GLOIN_2v752299 [Rhizophagus irregularis DAOM 181602=DAOM 197198]GET53332.1 hypothetical protein GLOIN_2v752299 [Rhizophagus irregularis DAOM 181602=DAOM 197198]|eukprot:XP_025167641.1 hypothetical protein GLOIN_2v752299 [Rhizophagus irregularis DAOM 181602=DAOM 197198]
MLIFFFNNISFSTIPTRFIFFSIPIFYFIFFQIYRFLYYRLNYFLFLIVFLLLFFSSILKNKNFFFIFDLFFKNPKNFSC